jgi:hypothetical protein
VAKSLNRKFKISILYHNYFDYPLTKSELKKWSAGNAFSVNSSFDISIDSSSNCYFLKGRQGLLKKRLLRERYSKKKLKIAEQWVKYFRLIPTVKMVAVTGSLAMKNARSGADIDFMIITKSGSLWSTRILTLLFLLIIGAPLRLANKKKENNLLCLNLWMDESDLAFKDKDQNAYLAHEIVQIIPLINRNKTYERFIFKNSWARSYWPNALVGFPDKVKNCPNNPLVNPLSFILLFLEPLSRWVQFHHIKPRRTREIVTPTRAMFHPCDWGSKIAKYLHKNGILQRADP